VRFLQEPLRSCLLVQRLSLIVAVDRAHFQGPDTGSSDKDLLLNTDSSLHRRKLVGGATMQAMTRYLDRFFQHRGEDIIRPKFAHGMQYCEEVPIQLMHGLRPPLLPIPESQECNTFITLFFRNLHPMFPVLDRTTFEKDVWRLEHSDLDQLEAVDIAILASVYAVTSLGMDESFGGPTERGWEYLQAAYHLTAFLIAVPYVSSVQALILVSVALRGRHKDGAAWNIIGLAIRIAQSTGLHRQLHENQILDTGSREYRRDVILDARIWWACYCLEKMMALESGRPSCIQDSECDQMTPPADPDHDIFRHWIGLAQIQSRINEQLYHPYQTSRRSEDLLRYIAQLDSDLGKWEDSVSPESIR
jgi:hypothetical protein